ncbi:hypothetical protein HYX13_01720 [Candidatus Woesearchaeota archaeon]|nr:hypothetical protein [Candidatus Woesearchaeota archaeon]
MSQERLSELKELLYHLERKLRPLEWDASKNQINEFKRTELGRLKEEFARLSAEAKELEFSQQNSQQKNSS